MIFDIGNQNLEAKWVRLISENNAKKQKSKIN